jgi:NTE family protein
VTTVFVLGGGGNLGAVQVGMLKALTERGVRPDVVVGCSAGALNGAAFCSEPTLNGLARLDQLWRELDGKDVLPSGWVPTAVQLARRGEAIHGLTALERVVEGFLAVEAFDELTIPFQCVATALEEGREHWFTAGPLRPALVASSAVPAIYPPVEIDGVRYIDGAVVNDIPLSRAVEVGARQIYVLHVGRFDRPRPVPRRPLDMALQAYWIARRHRFRRDLAAMPDGIGVVVLPTGDPPKLRFNDFTRSEELIEHAYVASGALLDAG